MSAFGALILEEIETDLIELMITFFEINPAILTSPYIQEEDVISLDTPLIYFTELRRKYSKIYQWIEKIILMRPKKPNNYKLKSKRYKKKPANM